VKITALRSYSTAGVAVVGAAVIAVSPIAPPPIAGIPTESRPVALAASPFSAYQDFLANLDSSFAILNTIADLPLTALPDGVTLESVLTSPVTDPVGRLQALVTTVEGIAASLPAQTQTLVSQLSPVLEHAIGRLAAGDVDSATRDTLGAAVIVLVALGTVGSELAGPIAGPGIAPLLGGVDLAFPAANVLPFIVAGPALNAVGGTGESAQAVIDALESGNPRGVANAVIEAPARVADRAVNGGYEVFTFPAPLPGLLTSGDIVALPGVAEYAIGTSRVVRSLINTSAASTLQQTSATPRLLTNSSNKFEPRKLGSTDARPGQRVKSAVQGVTSGIKDSIEGVRDTVKKLTGRSETKKPAADDN
jgi:hypothetical protein